MTSRQRPNKTKSELRERVTDHDKDTPNQTNPKKPQSQNIKTELTFTQKCVGSIKYIILFALIPPFLNYAALHQEKHKFELPGLQYDIGGGQQMYLNCQGKGKPTVLLDAPTGTSSDVWVLIQEELAKITKVCTYDRAGLGFSDRIPMNYSAQDSEDVGKLKKGHEYTVERMADDLFHLLTYSSNQIEKPFIMAGSELGALVARFYTQIYESDVSDLVLIDPLVEGLFENDEGVWIDYWFNHLLPSFQTMQFSAATGLTRLALILNLIDPPLTADNIPIDVTARQKHMLCNPRHLSSVVDEYHFINETFSQMQTVFSFKQFPSNISVTVVTGNYFDAQLPSQLNKAWAKSQQHLISEIHPQSSHIVLNGEDHHMLYKNPLAVVEPIKRVVRKARNKHIKGSETR